MKYPDFTANSIHKASQKRKKALHFHCLTDLKLPHTSVTSSDGLKRENTLNVRIHLATFCVQRRRYGQTKRGRGAEEYKKVKQRWLSC